MWQSCQCLNMYRPLHNDAELRTTADLARHRHSNVHTLVHLTVQTLIVVHQLFLGAGPGELPGKRVPDKPTLLQSCHGTQPMQPKQVLPKRSSSRSLRRAEIS